MDDGANPKGHRFSARRAGALKMDQAPPQEIPRVPGLYTIPEGRACAARRAEKEPADRSRYPGGGRPADLSDHRLGRGGVEQGFKTIKVPTLGLHGEGRFRCCPVRLTGPGPSPALVAGAEIQTGPAGGRMIPPGMIYRNPDGPPSSPSAKGKMTKTRHRERS